MPFLAEPPSVPIPAVQEAAGKADGETVGGEDGAHPGATDRTAALPVELDLHGRHAGSVRAWVEGTLGWQPVAGATAGLVPPAVVLRDLGPDPAPGAPVSAGTVPSILLVDDDAPPRLVGERAAALRPDAVVAWPSGRAHLVAVVDQVLERPRAPAEPGSSLRIGGSAGGVGTTVVTLALAGLAAWRGVPTLAAVRRSGPGPRTVPTAALAGVGVWARAEPLPGITGCRAVRLVDHDEVPAPSDPGIGMLMVDAGVDPEVDVLVCRPDAAALTVLGTTTAAAVVVVGDGPVPERELRRAAAGRSGILLPWSVRVARADLVGRVPAGLPGAWLKRLLPLLPDRLSGPSTRGAGGP